MKQVIISIIMSMLFMAVPTAKAEIIITAESDTTIQIKEVSSISFDGDFKTGSLVINYADGTHTSTPIQSISQISFKSESTEPDAINHVESAPTIAVQGDLLFITTEGGRAAIYDGGGRLVQQTELRQGTTTLSLAALPKGVYIVNINGHSAKISKPQ